MKKRIIIICLIFVLFVIFISAARDQIIKSLITVTASGIIGSPVKIDGFSLSVFKQAVRIKGFKLYNPAGYPKEVFLDIPEINVDFDLPALLKKKIHLPLIVINLRELVVIKDKEGKLNVDSLKVAQPQKKAGKQEEKEMEQLPMQIDILTLSIGRVISKDFKVEEKPSIQIFDVGVKEKTYKNITSAQQLVGLVLVESMKPAAIRSAGIYSAVSMAGVAFLPAGVAMAITGKDSVTDTFKADFDNVYKASLDTLREMGQINSEDKSKGIIKAKIEGASVVLKINSVSAKEFKVTISARKILMPKIQIASLALHKLTEKLR